MSILQKMGDQFEIVASDEKSSEIDIENLKQFAAITVPEEFLTIIREQTEIEICVVGKKYIRLWGAAGCIEMNEAYGIQNYIPDSLAVGDDEGGNAVLYAHGRDGFGVYMVAFNDLDEDDMTYISDSLESFFVCGMGIDIFNSL